MTWHDTVLLAALMCEYEGIILSLLDFHHVALPLQLSCLVCIICPVAAISIKASDFLNARRRDAHIHILASAGSPSSPTPFDSDGRTCRLLSDPRFMIVSSSSTDRPRNLYDA